MPTYLMPRLHPGIERPVSTPPVMTREMASLRMFGPEAQASTSTSKRFRFGRKRSIGNSSRPVLPPGNRSALEPLPSLQHVSPQQENSSSQQQRDVPSHPSDHNSPVNELARSLGLTEAVNTLRGALSSAPTPSLMEAARTAFSILVTVSDGVRVSAPSNARIIVSCMLMNHSRVLD